ncbi:MAG: 5'/3'-nucleotidase SurE [Alteromonadaceae bacterium]|nr:5'/3'-nucleotidase SurE [Alteromonadaceae bacterium]
MSAKPFRRLLLTNDDGIAAPGLAVLEEIAAALADEVWVFAPEHDRSGAGQSISLHAPLRVYGQGERRYAVSGTPADCVLFAMAEWLADSPPDLVLSGVNCGANVSDSVQYSGTVGAVLCAQHLGLPAISLSQAFHQRDSVNWEPVTRLAPELIVSIWNQSRAACCWNVNFPDMPVEQIQGNRLTTESVGSAPRARMRPGQDGRGLPYWWLMFERNYSAVTGPEEDVTALREGFVSVAPMRNGCGWKP